jgi:uncharacterized protein
MKEIIEKKTVEAMRNKSTLKLNVLRSLKTAMTNISLQKGNINESLSQSDCIALIRKLISQRQDSIAQFQKANRTDLIEIEQKEIEILQEFLPEELSEEQINNIVQQAIQDTQATTKKDMGKAIKRALELAEGRVDNKTISQKIGERL